MSLRREPFRTFDGQTYTLWADINDVMGAVMPDHWSKSRESRRKRGWMYRGQRNADWNLIPSLYRAPLDDDILKARQRYTGEFIHSLKREAAGLGVGKVTESECLAIGQHYGFYTPLLDFSWNLEVAAYFATLGGQTGQVGAIFAFNADEYERLRNPFAALGLSLDESDATLKNAGEEALPDLELVQLRSVRRILEQEGIFIRVTLETVKTLLRECIDRYYFRQLSGVVYMGSFAHSAHWLPSPRMFASSETYDAFMELARNERPELFERTRPFAGETLFPPADPLSVFAERWKREHPDPSAVPGNRRGIPGPSTNKARSEDAPARRFAAQIEEYYRSDFARSPYKSGYLLRGRQLVESLCAYPQLDAPEAQRWLLWELLKRAVRAGLKCTIKLGNARTWDPREDGFRLIIVDRWLADSYQKTFEWEALRTGFWRVRFGALSERGRPRVDLDRAEPFTPPSSVTTLEPSNPHVRSQAPEVRRAVELRLAALEEGVRGSFLYDFHHVVMMTMGRNLQLTIAMVEAAPCLQRSPLVRQEHVTGPALLVRVVDGFTGGVTHTAVCAKHWDHMCEGDVDLMRPSSWTPLGLA